MPPAINSLESGVRTMASRTRRLRFSTLLFAFMLLLAGCRFLKADMPAPVSTATLIPRRDPIPTIEVLDSEALYGQDSQSIGQTIPSLASFSVDAVLPPVPSGDSERGVIVSLDANTFLGGELFRPDGLRLPGVLLLGADVPGLGFFTRAIVAARICGAGADDPAVDAGR